MKTSKGAHALAWLTFVFGVLVSMAGNVGHAASDGLKPGEWAGAAFWPLALMLSVELLTRVRWQPERRWTVARLAGLVLVAMVAAVLSYRHLAGLLRFWGEDVLNAYLGPLAVDGLMLIAATALLSISKERTAVPEELEVTPKTVDLEMIRLAFQPPEPDPSIDPEPEPEQQPVKVLEDVGSATVDGRLHIVENVSETDQEEAARQAWIQSGQTLPVREVAEIMGKSVATAHRRISGWKIPR